MRVELNGLLEIGKYQIHQRDGLFVLSHNSKEFGSLKGLVEAISIVTKFSKNEVEVVEKENLKKINELLDEDPDDDDDDLETEGPDFGDDDEDDIGDDDEGNSY